MILVGLLGLFILRYGPRLRYVTAVFFVAAFGMQMGLRHLGNFVQLDVDMGAWRIDTGRADLYLGGDRVLGRRHRNEPFFDIYQKKRGTKCRF